ncbi:U-box domain-containing protein 17 [Platanthera guangdongensis]|uniref:RING-type E3 ubiquitin transferase n=1 Tax=Platanthera guangdongensis TaxID=2320717 RepID=A0ABR2LFN5_9ASPA
MDSEEFEKRQTPAMSDAVVNALRKPPPPAAFFVPEGLTDFSFLHLLVAVAGDLVSVVCRPPRYQGRNFRRLTRRIRILLVLFEFLLESQRPLPPLALLCFKEFYIVVSRAKVLLDYCSQSSRLWLLLRNQEISGYFHDLERDICTLLDVLPLDELCLAADMREHVELLRRQVGTSGLHFDDREEQLRVKVLTFLNEIEKGRLPDHSDMESTFIDRIGMLDAEDFDSEIKFLENQISSTQDDDAEADHASVGGIIAVVRYCRFSLFGCQRTGGGNSRSSLWSPPPHADDISTISIPTDFCCPISLELMREPVVVITGQTYDRKSITQWIASGHRTCPNSGQILGNAYLVPNYALSCLISHWCRENGVPCDSQASSGGCGIPAASKAEVEANRATIRILIRNLSGGAEDSKAAAAHELRMLAKTGKENRANIAKENAIPLLCLLLRSQSPIAQENAVTALLNLSINDANKTKIISQTGCLSSIIRVLRRGLTPVARENAAAALFSLSAVHDYKKRITEEPSGVEALARLLRKGTARGRKDAAMALFNLSTHPENWERMVVSGAVAALVGAVRDEEVAEEAAGALALLARQPVVAGMVGWEEQAVVGLAGVMSAGSARGRENAAAALHEICRRGGAEVAERVARVPGVAGVVQTVALAGTKRARRKAAELARMLERREHLSLSLAPAGLRGGGWVMEQVSPVAVPVTVL